MKRYLLAISTAWEQTGFRDIERHSDDLELLKEAAMYYDKNVNTSLIHKVYEILDTSTGDIHDYNEFTQEWDLIPVNGYLEDLDIPNDYIKNK